MVAPKAVPNPLAKPAIKCLQRIYQVLFSLTQYAFLSSNCISSSMLSKRCSSSCTAPPLIRISKQTVSILVFYYCFEFLIQVRLDAIYHDFQSHNKYKKSRLQPAFLHLPKDLILPDTANIVEGDLGLFRQSQNSSNSVHTYYLQLN